MWLAFIRKLSPMYSFPSNFSPILAIMIKLASLRLLCILFIDFKFIKEKTLSSVFVERRTHSNYGYYFNVCVAGNDVALCHWHSGLRKAPCSGWGRPMLPP